MKKVAIGCLGVFVVLLLAGAGAGYWFIWRPAQGFIQNVESLEQIETYNKQVSNTSGFSVPEDGVIRPEQLDRYLAVQSQMKASLSETISELDTKYETFDDDNVTFNDIRQLASAYKDIIDLVIEAKEVQVQALNAQDFSLSEYAWVKREALRAAALPFTSLDLSELSGETGINLPEITQDIPQANIDLLEPHRENLEDVIGLAFFGL